MSKKKDFKKSSQKLKKNKIFPSLINSFKKNYRIHLKQTSLSWKNFFNSFIIHCKDFYTTYFNRKIITIFLMGFGSGLPLLLGISTLSYWMKQENISLKVIGFLLSTSSPYTLKFLWAPLVVQLKIPFLTQILGKKRAWLIILQILLALSIFALGQSKPSEGLYYLSIMTVLMAFLSATQDIFVDAYRIELLNDKEQGPGAAATQAGYRIGMLCSGAGALVLSDYFSWSFVYSIMALLISVGTLGVLIAPRIKELTNGKSHLNAPIQTKKSFHLEFKSKVLEPFLEFTRRRNWFLILSFIICYKYGDAIFGGMSNPFYQSMGFSGKEIALVSKGIGTAATMLGIFAGGFLVFKQGFFKSLLIGGVLQALTNLIFVYTSMKGDDIFALTIAIFTDNFTGGIGSSAFVAYLSFICHKKFTATQYALFSSLTAFGRVNLSVISGWLAENLGWPLFFIATTSFALPGLLLLFSLKNQPEFKSSKA